MNIISSYSSVTTDSSQTISARYGEAAGTAIAVDTGLSVFIGIETIPSYQIIPDIIYPIPLKERELTPFSKSEISRMIQLDSKTNPLLADIWRDDINDEFVSS